LSAQLAAVDIQVRRITASVLLIKALGGDWNAATPARAGLAANSLPAAP
jgi:outer membrane protein TolC